MSTFLGDCCNSIYPLYHDNSFLVRAWHALRAIKLRVWDSLNLHHQRGTTRINILTTFPLYAPNSAGRYRERSAIAIQSINRVFPLLSTLAETATGTTVTAKPLESFPLTDDERAASERLAAMFRKYGSDKSTTHNYHLLYGPLLHRLGRVHAMLEIGLGTNHTDIVSNMGMICSASSFFPRGIWLPPLVCSTPRFSLWKRCRFRGAGHPLGTVVENLLRTVRRTYR